MSKIIIRAATQLLCGSDVSSTMRGVYSATNHGPRTIDQFTGVP